MSMLQALIQGIIIAREFVRQASARMVRMERIELSGTDVQLEARWNCKYVIGPEAQTITVTIPEAAPAGVATEIGIVINVGATVPNVTLPANVRVNGDEMSFGERYELWIDEDYGGIASSDPIPAEGT